MSSEELSSSYYKETIKICTSSMFALIGFLYSVLIAEIRISFCERIRRLGMEKGVPCKGPCVFEA